MIFLPACQVSPSNTDLPNVSCKFLRLSKRRVVPTFMYTEDPFFNIYLRRSTIDVAGLSNCIKNVKKKPTLIKKNTSWISSSFTSSLFHFSEIHFSFNDNLIGKKADLRCHSFYFIGIRLYLFGGHSENTMFQFLEQRQLGQLLFLLQSYYLFVPFYHID